jgi:hypothetical protein
MSDRSAKSSDPGFVPFRSSTALSGALDPAGPRVAPPLPPRPPGAIEREVKGPAASPASRPPGRAPRPPPPAPGSSRAQAWSTLFGWCESAGLAQGALVAGKDGELREAYGDLPGAGAAVLGRILAANLAEASRAEGSGPEAVAIDVGGRWVTGFHVRLPGEEEAVVGLAGSAPIRAEMRAALAGWIADALARPG